MMKVGPTRWYCIAESCTKYIVSDSVVWCEEHWLDWLEGRCPKVKSAMTIEGYRQIIRECRDRVVQHHTMTQTTLPGQTFPPATSVLNNNTRNMSTENVRGKTVNSANTTNIIIQEIADLRLENFMLKQENHSLRELVKLFKAQTDSFLTAFQATIDGVH